MRNQAQQETRAARGSLRAALLAVLVSVSALAIGVTGAIFTDSASVGSNDFTTGTIDISTSAVSSLLTNLGLAPGGIVENPITVTNAGSLQLRYAVQRSGTNADAKALRDSLRLRVGLRAGAGCDFPYYTIAGATNALTDDTQLYEGLGFPAGATNTIGDAAQGNQTNDRVLAGGANEVLCFSVVLPTSAGNLLQNASTTVTLDFVAEQTANN